MDTILYNGTIHTLAGGRVVSALAIQGDRIAFAGSDAQALALQTSDTRLVDLKERCVLPGFGDSHMHFVMTEVSHHRMDLRNVTSVEELIQRGRDFLASQELKPGEWVIGYGYDHHLFREPVLPDAQVVDAMSTQHPIILDRVCGHAGAANHLAMELAGFDEHTPLPEGEAERDEQGKLTGVFHETALELLKKATPRLDPGKIASYVREAGRRVAASGITSVHSDDFGPEGTDWPVLAEAFRQLEKENACSVRLWEEWESPRPDHLRKNLLAQSLRSGEGTDWLRLVNIKLIADGSLGARSAYMEEDYSNDPGNRGIAVYTQAELEEMVALCHDNDLQVACHAIGDASCTQFVQAVEKAMARNPKPLRHRVVHCQFGNQALYRRMGALGMGADVQPAFVPSDYSLLSSYVGEKRMQSAYAWRSLLEAGVGLGGGSDSPVEDFSPLYGIHCAVNRPDGQGGVFNPRERLTIPQAVSLYTTGPAWLAGAEKLTGTLEPGKYADLVVLSGDIFQTPPERLLELQVEMTMAGGRVTFGGL